MLEVIGESEKATNLKQINAAKLNCKLDIWVWGNSGIKKRERKNTSTLDLQVPWAFVSIWNILKQHSLPCFLLGMMCHL